MLKKNFDQHWGHFAWGRFDRQIWGRFGHTPGDVLVWGRFDWTPSKHPVQSAVQPVLVTPVVDSQDYQSTRHKS